MVEQLRLILRVTGEERLAANLSKDSDAALQVLRALALQSAAQKPKPKSSKGADGEPGPQLF
jgi:hypothetical protein